MVKGGDLGWRDYRYNFVEKRKQLECRDGKKGIELRKVKEIRVIGFGVWVGEREVGIMQI